MEGINKTVLIIGAAGGIGNLLANLFNEYKLDKSTKIVTLLREKTAMSVKKNRLTLELGNRTISFTPEIITSLLGFQPQGSLIIIPAVKMFDFKQILDDIKSSKLSVDLFITPQNGVEAEDMVMAQFPDSAVISMSITLPVETDPQIKGFARITSLKGGIADSIAHGDVLKISPYINMIADSLTMAQINNVYCHDWRQMKWTKLMLNLIGNASCALLDMCAKEFFGNIYASILEFAMLREYFQLIKDMRQTFVSLPGWKAEKFKQIRWLTSSWLLLPIFMLVGIFVVAKARGDKLPGLHHSFKNGEKKSEVDYYNGAVAQRSQMLVGAGMSTHQASVNQFLTEALNSAVKNGFSIYAKDPHRLLYDFWRHMVTPGLVRTP